MPTSQYVSVNPYDIQFVEDQNLLRKRILAEDTWEEIIDQRILTSFIAEKQIEAIHQYEEARREYIRDVKMMQLQVEVFAREYQQDLSSDESEIVSGIVKEIGDLFKELGALQMQSDLYQAQQNILHTLWDNAFKTHADNIIHKLNNKLLKLVDAEGKGIELTLEKMAKIHDALKPKPLGKICKVNPVLAESLLTAAKERKVDAPNVVAENMMNRSRPLAGILAIHAATGAMGSELLRAVKRNGLALETMQLKPLERKEELTLRIEEDVRLGKKLHEVENQMRDKHDAATVAFSKLPRPMPGAKRKREEELAALRAATRKTPLNTKLEKK